VFHVNLCGLRKTFEKKSVQSVSGGSSDDKIPCLWLIGRRRLASLHLRRVYDRSAAKGGNLHPQDATHSHPHRSLEHRQRVREASPLTVVCPACGKKALNLVEYRKSKGSYSRRKASALYECSKCEHKERV